LELFERIRDLDRVLVRPEVSNTHAMVFLPTNVLFSNKLCVFALSNWGSFVVLQSSIHEIWARQFASTMRTDMSYTTADCFEAFPFPEQTSEFDTIGEPYYQHRQSIMLARKEGLTKTYNRFHKLDETAADIQQLRELHQEMDEAVARAYGWTNLRLDHDFHETRMGVRFTISEAGRREVLDRLLELNHQRYAEEEDRGLHEKGAKTKAITKESVKGKSGIREALPGGVKRQPELFAASDQKDLFEE
jgi:restriction-modification enzyme MmeI-like protein